jgi:hypothetical protein
VFDQAFEEPVMVVVNRELETPGRLRYLLLDAGATR